LCEYESIVVPSLIYVKAYLKNIFEVG
jgi:hypothetical protein